MIIIKNLIANYINNLSMEDINFFAIKNNIILDKKELEFIYNFIKKNYLVILNDPNNFSLSRYKDNFSEENYNKIEKLLNEYRKKYMI